GPPYQVYVLPLRLDKMVYAGTTTVLFAYINAVKLVPYWALGQLSAANLKVAAVLAIPASLAVFAGVWLVRVLPTKLFYQLVIWALLAISARLLWSALLAG
ncbi:MAG: sulfite exporter TauE/SafE family protein, partial [Rhodobacteraceae bacterium]|nr:sulfite exporter TauE/SafE family protein [Paracoccaceae bacterium]